MIITFCICVFADLQFLKLRGFFFLSFSQNSHTVQNGKVVKEASIKCHTFIHTHTYMYVCVLSLLNTHFVWLEKCSFKKNAEKAKREKLLERLN